MIGDPLRTQPVIAQLATSYVRREGVTKIPTACATESKCENRDEKCSMWDFA